MKELMRRMTFITQRIEGEIVGVAALEEKGKGMGQVHWVYVLPEHQRKGVGTTLMRFIESESMRRDLKQLTVITSKRAEWARNFYVKLDYELVDTKDTPEGGVAMFEKVLGLGYSSDQCPS